ncbi:MAG: hypothetical protein J1E81_09530 [Eubacterium sp.]|nr:hypothetical protein [Eubacterium sp.]
MKKNYITPEVDIEKFNIPSSVISTSSYPGQGGGDEEIDPFAGREF